MKHDRYFNKKRGYIRAFVVRCYVIQVVNYRKHYQSTMNDQFDNLTKRLSIVYCPNGCRRFLDSKKEQNVELCSSNFTKKHKLLALCKLTLPSLHHDFSFSFVDVGWRYCSSASGWREEVNPTAVKSRSPNS